MDKIKLNSHVLHSQIKCKHANAESAKLTNHDTAPSTPPPSPPSSSGPKLDAGKVGAFMSGFGSVK